MSMREHNSGARWRQWLPSRGNVVFTLLVAAALLWAANAGVLASPTERATAAAAATSSTTMGYQGYLVDSAGNPVNDTVDIVFRLYSVASGGTALWSETHSGVVITDGLFSTLLGSSTSIPISVLANNSDLWLGVTVGADEEMTPREKVASAPYAMVANVPDGGISTLKLADKAVTTAKIADNAITTTQINSGAVGTSDLANGSVTQTKLSDIRMYVTQGSISVDVDGEGCATVTFPSGRFTKTPHVFLTRRAIGSWEDGANAARATFHETTERSTTGAKFCVHEPQISNGAVGFALLAVQTD